MVGHEFKGSSGGVLTRLGTGKGELWWSLFGRPIQAGNKAASFNADTQSRRN